MPAIDSCEPQMIRAFQKANWSIGDQPFAIRLAEKRDHVFADLRLINRSDNAQIVVIEVKCFPDSRSQLDEFYHAVGQYLVYRSALVLDDALYQFTWLYQKLFTIPFFIGQLFKSR